MQAQGRVVSAISLAESSSREQDGLNGPVRRLRVETAKILLKEGRVVEAPHVLREISTYDPKGRKIDGVAYPVEGSTLPGKEQYQYDDKGNIVEMILRADDRSILSKEKYDYEFDEFGNWKKMTSSRGIYESGKLNYKPVEVTYRLITYYYNQVIDKVASSRSKSREGSGSTAKAGLPAGEPKTAPAQTSATVARPTYSVSSSSVVPTAATPSVPVVSSYQKGLACLAEGRHSEAAQALKQAVQQNPHDAMAYLKLGLAYSGLRQYQEAITALKMAISIKPEVVDTEEYYQLGQAYASLGKHADALRAFTQALYITRAQAIDPEGAKGQRLWLEQIRYGLGLAHYKLERYKEAIAELKQVINLNPKNAEGYYALALAYIGIDDQPSAENLQKPLRALNPALADKVAQALYIHPVRCSDITGCR
jgi:tetratricopeptide (TPR) repeat protein